MILSDVKSGELLTAFDGDLKLCTRTRSFESYVCMNRFVLHLYEKDFKFFECDYRLPTDYEKVMNVLKDVYSEEVRICL